MLKTGFGQSGKFAAMYSFDRSQKTVPDFDFVAYPTRGLMPVEYFNGRYAWSVSLNPKKFRTPDSSVRASIVEVDRMLDPVGEPLKLNHNQPNTLPFGLPGCIVFRPEKIDLTPGKRYLVEIEGLKRTDPKAPGSVSYIVEFFSLK
jgi:hypothetical protein